MLPLNIEILPERHWVRLLMRVAVFLATNFRRDKTVVKASNYRSHALRHRH